MFLFKDWNSCFKLCYFCESGVIKRVTFKVTLCGKSEGTALNGRIRSLWEQFLPLKDVPIVKKDAKGTQLKRITVCFNSLL